YDRNTNLFYNYFRDYDPQTGRYVQSDPLGLDGGINTYGYVDGNPLSYVDPEGLQFKTVPRFFPPVGPARNIDPVTGQNLNQVNFDGDYSRSRDRESADAARSRDASPAQSPALTGPTTGGCGKWMCEGPGQFDKVGTQKDVTRIGWFIGYGSTETEAAFAWKKLVQNASPNGYNARHIKPRRCKKIG
ncbi:RHS repeat-associated core domain-containing protein, partial [Massilia atriviolacea]